MSDRMNNIMSDLESIVKIGVHIIYEELVKILRVMMSFLNDVSRPKGMTKIMTKRLTKVDTGIEYEINFERNRYGFPRGITSENVHFPKDINHPIGITSDLKGEGGDNE